MAPLVSVTSPMHERVLAQFRDQAGAGTEISVESHGGRLMLVGGRSIKRTVIHRTLRTVSIVCCLLVVVSFGLFARDQVAGASARQQGMLASGAPVAASTPPATHRTGQPRRFIDGAAGELTAPFRTIAQADNVWVSHGVPALLALLVYGVGLGMLARFAEGRE